MLTPESLMLPREIAQLLSGATLSPVTIGRSRSQVYLARTDGQPARYLKIASQPFHEELADERHRLDWIHGRLPVPEALAFARDNESSYLLLSEVLGTVACDTTFSVNISALVQLLASGLRQIHQLDIAGCPFDMRLDQRIAEAERRMRSGAVDEEDFDQSRLGIAVEFPVKSVGVANLMLRGLHRPPDHQEEGTGQCWPGRLGQGLPPRRASR